jgi:3-oxoadipate enol-lactonase
MTYTPNRRRFLIDGGLTALGSTRAFGANDKLFPYVQDLRMPTLILIGSSDIADNQAVDGALVMAIPGAARVVVPDTGHLLYLEKPDLFSPIVIGFLTSHGF